MDRAFAGAVPYVRNGPGGQVINSLRGLPCAVRALSSKAMHGQEQMQSGALRKIIVILVLLLIVIGFYVSSFFVMGG